MSFLSPVVYAKAEQISLQLKWKHQFQFAGYYMALEKGFYQAAGLDVEIIEGGVEHDPITHVLEHRGGYAVTGPGALIEHSKGKPIKVLAAIFQHSPLALMVRKDSGIESISDLSGRRIMFSKGSSHMEVLAALQYAGVTEFTRQAVSYDIQDLILDRTDAYPAYATAEPAILKRMGVAYRLLSLKTPGADFYGDVIISSSHEVAEHAGRTERFLEATRRGWQYALDHAEESVDLILLNYNSQKLFREDLMIEAAELAKFMMADVVPIGYMHEQRWQGIADSYAALKMLPADYNVHGFIYQKETGLTHWFKLNSETAFLWFLLLLSLWAVGFGWIYRRHVVSKNRLSLLQESEFERERAQWKLTVKNRSLERALSKAEQATQAKGQFLAMMSHEIRTPLNGVLGLTELVLSTDLNGQQRKNLQTAHASGCALLTILNDILDFSKMEAGLMEINEAAFDVNQLLERVSMLFSSRLYDSKGDVQMVVRGVPIVSSLYRGDVDRLHQVMMNLLSNAVKFTEQGEIIISIDVLSESDTDVTLRFQVSDTGMGISSQDQQDLFEEFTQADGTDMRKHGGTGLGLAIVKRLVAMMGGAIEVESKLGLGSRFFFNLTLHKVPGAVENSAADISSLAGVQVLIVDAHEPSASMLHALLSAWGLECTVCGDVELAMPMLTDKAYQLVLVDGKMRGELGKLLIEMIASEPAFNGLKVIGMMALDVNMEDFHGDNIMHGFLRKPVYQDSLLETLQDVMDKKQRPYVEKPAEIRVLVRQERILLAEDNPVNQQVICGMLSHQGFTHIDVAENGVEAIKMYKDGKYELILMDIQMPKMGGLEASEKIRELERLQVPATHTPIVALTAHALQEDRQKSLDAGMDDHLTKPISGQKIASILARYLPQSSAELVEPNTVVESSESDVVLDKRLLRALRKDIGFGLGAILDTYVAELPKQLEAIVMAIESNDAEALRQHAHRLKGGSRSVAALSLGELCYQLELLGQQKALGQAKTCVEKLQQAIEAVQQAMSEDWLSEVR
ncbi:MAG: ABC transporter substrate-binding protein [Mariprofundaceae bacterium]